MAVRDERDQQRRVASNGDRSSRSASKTLCQTAHSAQRALTNTVALCLDHRVKQPFCVDHRVKRIVELQRYAASIASQMTRAERMSFADAKHAIRAARVSDKAVRLRRRCSLANLF